MQNPIDDNLHADLCAWLLGELEPERAAELERACAESAELEAERVRLAATIGLVQGNLEPEPALSSLAMTKLMDAAEAEVSTPILTLPWWRQSSNLVAAAITVMVGGGLAFFSMSSQLNDNDNDVEFAGVTESAAPPADKGPGRGSVTSEEIMALASLGYSSDSAEGEATVVIADSEKPAGSRARSLNAATTAKDLPKVVHATEDIPDSGVAYEGGLPKNQSQDRKQSPDRETLGQEALDSLSAMGYSGGVADGEVVRDALRESERRAKKDPATGSDNFFLGRGTGGKAGEKARGREGSEAGGTYRGPGDSAPPAERAPTSVVSPGGGAAGPSSPGPAGPSTPASKPKGGSTPPPPAAASTPEASPLDSKSAEVRHRAENGRPGAERLAELAELNEALAGIKGLGYVDGDLDFDFARGAYNVDELSRRYTDEFIRSCAVRPNERPRDMFFRFYGDNPFEYVPQDPRSTFSVDVDTASYALARNYLERGHLPTKAQIRTEEFVNYFDADVPPPTEGDFTIQTELAPSLFGSVDGRYMMRVGLRGRVVAEEDRDPFALTFVIDVSGSMKQENRLELVKHALRLLLTQLREGDQISIVTFSNSAHLLLPMTPVTDRVTIESRIQSMNPGGSTNADAGIKLGYVQAMGAASREVTSRVVFLSDGVANMGQTDQDVLSEQAKTYRAQGIYLNTIGVGMGNHNDVFLEQLANLGDGVCDYVDSAETAKRALVDRFSSAMVPIASDVKVQVVFDPNSVARYRLLGYENRAIADQDFENDAVDAGEIGSGHQVVALYELDLLQNAEAERLATVRLRYKEPKFTGQDPLEVQVFTKEQHVAPPKGTETYQAASLGYQRSVLVAQFAEFLRRSSHSRGDSIQSLLAESVSLANRLGDQDFNEFVGLVRKAEPHLVQLQVQELQNELGMTLHEYRQLAYNRALLNELQGIEDRQQLLNDIQQQNDVIEDRIHDLIHDRLKNR